MGEDYAEVKNQLDGTDEAEEAAIKRAVTNPVKNFGIKTLAGGMAAVQSLSATSIAGILGIVIGFTSGVAGVDEMPITFRDDTAPVNEYQCIDNYTDAYNGLFGTITEQPLPEYDSAVLLRLKEINEWSKEYVGQSVTDSLVCDDPLCSYYGHQGCTNPDHPVKRIPNGQYTYLGSGARIDLANVKRIHSFFRAYGLTDVQIAAMLGVMTVESHVDFTSVENYNIAGARYNLDPSIRTSEYGFKPWAEGIGDSPITTATCIHQISSNTQPGPEPSINYGAYSSRFGNIWKLGVGLIGFTDGPGFQLNTYLRNYADYVNDRVTLIQRLVEGSKGWQDSLRRKAADAYDNAYGSIGASERGTATHYLDPSTGYEWKKAFNEYIPVDLEFMRLIEEYNAAAEAYVSAADALSGSFDYHTVAEQPVSAPSCNSTVYKIVFEKHRIDIVDEEEYVKYVTDDTSGQYVTTRYPEKLYECGEDEIDSYYGYIEYSSRNDIDVIFPLLEPVYEEQAKRSLSRFLLTNCNCPPDPGPAPSESDYEDWVPDEDEDGNELDTGEWVFDEDAYEAAYDAWREDKRIFDEAKAEHDTIEEKIATVNGLISDLIAKYEAVKNKKECEGGYDDVLEKFNETSLAHAQSVVQFYNAIHDYYLAAEFDMESAIRDAAFRDTSIFGDNEFYTAAAYNYDFYATIDNERVSFADVFGGLQGNSTVVSDEFPTVDELRLYYELWQNYAKYATNLPQSGKYINWWTPEVQMLFLVGGSYRSDLGRGIKIRDEYRYSTNPDGCPICSSAITEYDMGGQFYYNWMSTWKGDDYTGRDVASATKTFFHNIASGGFDDGTLDMRTEYAYAFYYMFQYGTPYQHAISYANFGGEASDIMDEMIAEGRWQVTLSNTLSDTAMPHNDKWKEFQTTQITHQWEIDTSTAMSHSILATLGKNQSRSKVNLLENIWNGCRYVNVIDNSTLGNAAIYLTDNPLLYEDHTNKYYIQEYGDGTGSNAQPVSSLYKVVYNIINRRLAENGKSTMGGDDMMTDGFTFVKTAVLWSGLDKEFENIENVEQLKEYLQEASSSIWQESESYQASTNTGRGNTRIWEQRKLGPYYDSGGSPYYKYKWYLVPRVLETRSTNTGTKWYDDLRNDADANDTNGNVYEDLDFWYVHRVNEHDVNNMPATAKGYATNGYARPANENGKMADWVRVDWECWDSNCPICHGKGGHGDTSVLCPGDIIIGPTGVGMWLGEDTVQSMYPLEALDTDDPLVYVGGTDAQKIKSMSDGMGFEWSKPCSSYVNHDTECMIHTSDATLPTSPSSSDPSSCVPYNPDGKWTVYRLSLPNYTDDYRSAGVTYRDSSDSDWEIWYKYRYKGVQPSTNTRMYLKQLRDELGR